MVPWCFSLSLLLLLLLLLLFVVLVSVCCLFSCYVGVVPLALILVHLAVAALVVFIVGVVVDVILFGGSGGGGGSCCHWLLVLSLFAIGCYLLVVGVAIASFHLVVICKWLLLAIGCCLQLVVICWLLRPHRG